MNEAQKIIAVSIHKGIQAQFLAETLNEHAVEGWRVQQVSTVVTRQGGSFYVLQNAYYADTYYLVLEKSDSTVTYRCLLQKREKKMDEDVSKLNALLDEQLQDGYRLVHMLHATSISPDNERPTLGTIAHVLIFEKEIGKE